MDTPVAFLQASTNSFTDLPERGCPMTRLKPVYKWHSTSLECYCYIYDKLVTLSHSHMKIYKVNPAHCTFRNVYPKYHKLKLRPILPCGIKSQNVYNFLWVRVWSISERYLLKSPGGW